MFATTRSCPASLYWPESGLHRIAPMTLDLDALPEDLQSQAQTLIELGCLADSIRALQTPNGWFLNEAVATAALHESAEALRSLARCVNGPESEVIAQRADALEHPGDDRGPAVRQAEIEERALVLLCGTISSWSRKPGGPFHGFVAAVSSPMDSVVRQADEHLEPLRRFLADIVERPDLSIRSPPGFTVTSLVACGGEPNGFPKHFAYFLPEDEGVPGARSQKTVVFSNVYRERFGRITSPIAERGLERFPRLSCEPEGVLPMLLRWFRGHDIGHQVRLPSTEYRALRPLGFQQSVMLQEAFADIIGYVSIADGPWAERFRHTRESAVTIFLAEALRYALRGREGFPDSDAAWLEISYLFGEGYIELSSCERQLVWEPDRVHEGLLALARELVSSMLDTDLSRTRHLIARCCEREEPSLKRWCAHLHRETGNVPTALAYRAER